MRVAQPLGINYLSAIYVVATEVVLNLEIRVTPPFKASVVSDS